MASRGAALLRPGVLAVCLMILAAACSSPPAPVTGMRETPAPSAVSSPSPQPTPQNALSISAMRERAYPGSDLHIERTLAAGSGYRRYIASYRSDGLKIFGLLTVPAGTKPVHGWPVIVFNHGYIPPQQYRTTERYVAYVDAFARAGYIVFKPDYRGHGSSEGQALGGYGTPDYTVDVLNAVSTLKRYPLANPDRLGMWGHSMGGQVTLRALVVDPSIKVAVIWAGVVAPYGDLLTSWHPPNPPPVPGRFSWRRSFVETYGTPQENPGFWDSISPNSFVGDIKAPVQLHHSLSDEEVPVQLSRTLAQELKDAGKPVQLFTYPGDDHNLSASFSLAMSRSIAFFDRSLKR